MTEHATQVAAESPVERAAPREPAGIGASSLPGSGAGPGPGQRDQAARLRRLVEAGCAGHADGADTLVSLVPPSTPTGSVSFRPRPFVPANLEPATAPVAAGPTAGRRPESVRPARETGGRPAARVQLARAIAVTSGKGGVGKSNLAVNLAVALSRMGRKVCLLDADLGMANVDVLCNLTPRRTLQHVVAGRCRLTEVMMLAPGGFRLIPGASGVAGMAEIGSKQRSLVLEQLGALEQVADDLIIDCAAGISANVLAFAAAAHTTLIATTPEPTAVTDAYGMVKSLVRHFPRTRPRLLVNMVTGDEEARGVHARMNRVTESFLRRSIDYAGAVPFDPAVPAAVRYRLPFVLAAPEAHATRAIEGLARSLAGVDPPVERRPGRGFFARVANWLG